MPAFDVVVVGAGIIGSSCAHTLSKRGFRVALLEQGVIPNPHASSADHARIFQLTFGKDSFCTDLALKSLVLWKHLQQELGLELLHQNGMLDLAMGDGRYEEDSLKTLQQIGLPAHRLDSQEACLRYRIFRPRAFRFALFHPDGGILWAHKAITELTTAGRKQGVLLAPGVQAAKLVKNKGQLQGIKDSRGKVWSADQYIFAAGPWSRELLKEYGLPLTLTRQESLYLRPPRNQGRYRPTHFPAFASLSKGFFGLPIHIHGFMQLGALRKGSVCRSASTPPVPDAKFFRKCRTFLKDTIPDLSDFTDMEGRAAFYTHTSDGDPIVDHLPDLPNAWIATGFSGKGPALAPLVAQIVTQLVCKEKPSIHLHRFRISRLRLRPK